MTRRKLVAGNWKMNGTAADLGEATQISMAAETADGVDVALCVPATLIVRACTATPGFAIGGQDVHAAANGAHTGDISAAMLEDAGASVVIVGHSERREAHGETSEAVAAKAEAALNSTLDVIVCCGESLDVREAGHAVTNVTDQIAASLPANADAQRLSVAYEPIWAIGTGKVAGPEEIGEMHAAIRSKLAEKLGEDAANAVRILYGGSVNGDNAAEIFAIDHVDGALVGGASLTAAKFVPIIHAATGRSV
ncbi:triose-phosphate isomerase [Sphingomicrobium flavum]|uniref:triose-phosphate isomerase n=1 Tax=Sphingomicrobium flavum TaxID=1229164 RepID=UPI0021AD5D84|nr:triose-phosphate isomerase [Sphingomicrobium flavum]